MLAAVRGFFWRRGEGYRVRVQGLLRGPAWERREARSVASSGRGHLTSTARKREPRRAVGSLVMFRASLVTHSNRRAEPVGSPVRSAQRTSFQVFSTRALRGAIITVRGRIQRAASWHGVGSREARSVALLGGGRFVFTAGRSHQGELFAASVAMCASFP